MLTIPQLNNLRDAAKNAIACQRTTGVPASVILSQWALESGWGAHTPGNNCFGIKSYSNAHGRQLMHTREFFSPEEARKWASQVQGRTAQLGDATPKPNGRYLHDCQDWFATFQSLSDCFIKRADLFKAGRYLPHYEEYQKTQNLVSFVQGIAPIYATDPEYGKHVLQIASMPEVQAAITDALSNVI